MTRRFSLLCIAAVALVLVWGGAASPLAAGPFSAHMIVHVTVMALAAPLIAIALASSAWDPTRRWPWLAPPMAAMLAALVVVRELGSAACRQRGCQSVFISVSDVLFQTNTCRS